MLFSQAVEHHLAAVTARDLPAYLATIHPQVMLVLPNGRLLVGAAAVGEFHRAWFAEPDWHWELTPRHSAEAGDTGVAVFDVAYTDSDMAMRYVLSLTFTRTGDGWKVLHDQNTPL